MQEWRFTILGVPQVKKNSRQLVVRKGRPISLPGKPYREWAQTALLQLRSQWMGQAPIPRTTWLNAAIVSYQAKGQACDASNLYQGPEDVLQEARIIENDYQIVSHDGSRRLRDAANPRVEITLTEVVE